MMEGRRKGRAGWGDVEVGIKKQRGPWGGGGERVRKKGWGEEERPVAEPNHNCNTFLIYWCKIPLFPFI